MEFIKVMLIGYSTYSSLLGRKQRPKLWPKSLLRVKNTKYVSVQCMTTI